MDCLLFSPPGKPVEDTAAVFAVEQDTVGMDDHETEVTTGVTTEEIVSIREGAVLMLSVVCEGRLGTSEVFLATEAMTCASDTIACDVTVPEMCDVILRRGGGVGNECGAEFA